MSTVINVTLTARQIDVLNTLADMEGVGKKKKGRVRRTLQSLVDDVLEAEFHNPAIRETLRARYPWADPTPQTDG